MGLFVMKYLSQGRPLHARLARLRHTPLAWLFAALGLAAAPLPALAALNDTGQITCVKGSRISGQCTGTGQDADHGRDVSVPRAKDGWRGFQFVKVCNNGSVAGKGGCLASAVQGPGPNDWGCTQDKVTGLVWELKTNDGGLHDRNRLFNDVPNDPANANVQVAAVNAAGLCGKQDWRRPSVDELFGLVDLHEQSAGFFPGMELNWFPDHSNGDSYWTNGIYADPDSAPRSWFVRFGLFSLVDHTSQFENLRLRLVRSAR